MQHKMRPRLKSRLSDTFLAKMERATRGNNSSERIQEWNASSIRLARNENRDWTKFVHVPIPCLQSRFLRCSVRDYRFYEWFKFHLNDLKFTVPKALRLFTVLKNRSQASR